jgi:hypothetical protein
LNNYYVYLYINPINNSIFYVGKGKDDRLLSQQRNYLFKTELKIIRKHKKTPIVQKIKNNLSEIEAFKLEEKLIKLYGRKDLHKGTLCNLTNGGEGESGHIHSTEHKTKISIALKGHPVSKNTRQKIGKANAKSLLGHKHTQTTKDKMSKIRLGSKHPFFGKHHSKQSRYKQRLSALKRYSNV